MTKITSDAQALAVLRNGEWPIDQVCEAAAALDYLAARLASTSPAPEVEVCETCGGSGQEQVSYTVAQCCGHQMENGDCCGNPEPAEDIHVEQCSDCGGAGEVTPFAAPQPVVEKDHGN